MTLDADAVSLCALSGCDLCATASSLATTTGDVVVCDCERVWEPRQRPSGVVDVATPRPQRRETAEAPRRSPRLVYVAPDETAPPPAPSPLDLAGARARRATDDPELVRVRRILAELRPDTTEAPPSHEAIIAEVGGIVAEISRLRAENTALAAERDAERAARRDYESCITLETSCIGCARLLSACRTAEERAEKAEAALARDPLTYQADCIHETIGRGRCSRCDSAYACLAAVRHIAFRSWSEEVDAREDRRLAEVSTLKGEIERLRGAHGEQRAALRFLANEAELRASWLASLPPGACMSPPPVALVESESASRKMLAEMVGGGE